VRNAGNARIWGIESDFFVRAAEGFTLGAGFSYNNAEITEDFCLIANPQFDCTLPGPAGETNDLLAPSGTRLPITAKFKGNTNARYEFPIGSLEGHVQGTLVYEGKRTSDLRLFERGLIGSLPSYTTVDLSAGVKSENWSVELYARNLFDSRGQITRTVQCLETTCGDPDGLTAIGGKFYTVLTTPRTIGLRVGTKF
jgi:outer membrane receptor protein involved in Fe transport